MLSRPDFDEDAEPAAGAGERSRALSVSELNRGVRGMLERGYPLISVRGEVSNFTRAASGHLYFVLKDAGAQVRCAMWRGKAQGLDFAPANGDAVQVRANVTLFEARGEFQLGVESMRRDGAGSLFEAFLRLKEKLTREGLFETARKRELPVMPRAIGVITSPQAAALRDVVTALRRRAPMIPVIVYPTPVQGEGAAARIAQAITTANARAEVDVLLLCRGGGSIEDLWSFNEEVVARAIVASEIPVISGVGHETDFTIADFAADLRAPTPTAAAELASPQREQMLAHLSGAAYELRRSMQAYLDEARQRLDWAARELVPPSARLLAQRRDLADLARRLDWQMQRGRERRAASLHALAARLRPPALAPAQAHLRRTAGALARAMRLDLRMRSEQLARLQPALAHLDPQQVLARGYSVVRDAAGNIVRAGGSVEQGAALDIRFAEGGAQVRVEKPYR
ncbi:MAG TPA: exodeoxyribonuclease VII large subunit [Burkholderiales bacterium]|jgi:exodeoxyribonuclease VII large subunit|nr:exodeoxyribonuclease VII large subunit [Burkholderiales bacterium]